MVHDLFQTDTVDFADVVLPATTTLEHFDIHKAYGHLYLSLSRPAIAPLGEAQPNTELFRLLAARMGLDRPVPARERRGDGARRARLVATRTCRASRYERLEREGSVRLYVPDPYGPFAEGGFPTPSGKCELYSDALGARGARPAAGYVPPREGPTSEPELARRFPLAFISPPAHHFLNSTFSAQPVFVRREGEPSADACTRDDAAPRGIADGQTVRTFNDRGAFLARARVSDAARRGVVVGLSIWWAKMCPGGRNANAVTEPGADRPGRRRDVLRRPGRGGSVMVGAFVAATVVTLVQYLRRPRTAGCCRSLPLPLPGAGASRESGSTSGRTCFRLRLAPRRSGRVPLLPLLATPPAARAARAGRARPASRPAARPPDGQQPRPPTRRA